MGATEAIAKALEKFTEVTGEHLRPWATRRQAKADAYKVEMVTKAEIAAMDLKQRSEMEREILDVQFQANIESIREKAKGILIDRGNRNLLPENIGQGESDPDWFTKFNEWARETSDVDVQALWAKVLAGEVMQPGRFSLRLLHLIRVLRKSDADKFHRLSRFAWIAESGDHFVLSNGDARAYMVKAHGIEDRLLNSLEALGLIREVTWDFFATESNKPRVCSYAGQWMTFTWQGNISGLHMIYLTELGAELHDVADPDPDEKYLAMILAKFESGDMKGWTLERHASPPLQDPDRWQQGDDVPRV